MPTVGTGSRYLGIQSNGTSMSTLRKEFSSRERGQAVVRWAESIHPSGFPEITAQKIRGLHNIGPSRHPRLPQTPANLGAAPPFQGDLPSIRAVGPHQVATVPARSRHRITSIRAVVLLRCLDSPNRHHSFPLRRSTPLHNSSILCVTSGEHGDQDPRIGTGASERR